MQQQLEYRLKQLKAESEKGQTMLTNLEVQRSKLRDDLLRISGAIQVLEEELAKADGETVSDGRNVHYNGQSLEPLVADDAEKNAP